MSTKNLSAKVNKTQLQHILEVSYKTACKEYGIIIDSLNLKRKYLTVQDLIRYGILP
jgi:hypothetical protein